MSSIFKKMSNFTHKELHRSSSDNSRKVFRYLSESETPTSWFVTIENLSSQKFKFTKKLIKTLNSMQNNQHMLTVTKYTYIKYKKIKTKSPACGSIEIHCEPYYEELKIFDYTQHSITLQDLETTLKNLLKLFKCFQEVNIPYLDILALNFQHIKVQNEPFFKICPFTEEFSVTDSCSLETLQTNKYYKLLPKPQNPFTFRLDHNKQAIFILGLKFTEIVTATQILETTSISELRQHILNIKNHWITNILIKMLENDEDARMDFLQLEKLCTQCGERDKFVFQYCKNGLCSQCLDSGKFCELCEHFEVLGDNFPVVQVEEIRNLCLCRIQWVLADNKLICNCGKYCLYCKRSKHKDACYVKLVMDGSVRCVCGEIGIRCCNTCYFFCKRCENYYCIVCLRPADFVSHHSCVGNLTIIRKV